MSPPDVPTVPILAAYAVGHVKESGRTAPIEMHCEGPDGSDAGVYVVKLHGDTQFGLGPTALAHELIAGLLARLLGIETPPVAVVRVDSGLGTRHRDPGVAERIARSTGLNFGSRLLKPAPPFNGVTPGQLQAAAEILFFDLLIQNPDRRAVKPNLLETPTGLAVIDHELAFPYGNPALVLGGVPEAWAIQRTDRLVHDHVLYPALKGKTAEVDFGPILGRLEALTADVLLVVDQSVPEPWRSPELDRIWDFLGRARESASRIRNMLHEVLA